MFRKCLLISLAVMLLFSLGGTIGCGKVGISGTYVCTEGGRVGYGHTVDSYYEFNSDGTFYISLSEGGGGIGEWKLEGDEITFMYPWGGALKGEIKDSIIVLEDGSTWVKE